MQEYCMMPKPEQVSYHGNPNLKPLAYQHDFTKEEIREAIKELLSVQKVELSVFADLRSELIKIASKKMDNAKTLSVVARFV